MLRTRFAPSPTGDLHVGGVRTALFCWLAAKKEQGKFILRIEDTDQERSTEESSRAILEGMQWLGLDFDEGPFYQSNCFDRYREVVAQLLSQGDAYRCDCSKERLDQLRASQMEHQEKPKYDERCRYRQGEIDLAKPYVVRFKSPHMVQKTVAWDDLVRGTIEFSLSELDDFVLLRSDGTPIYQLGVVVDDYDMQMTLVLRGDDHINNTPKQLLLFQALGVTPPLYGHVPMILGPDGKRLSKRHGAASVLKFREAGFLPHALLNYLVRLGWSYQDQEIFTLEEMIEKFNLDHLQKSPAIFNREKLEWLNHHYIKAMPFSALESEIRWHLKQQHLDVTSGPPLEEVVNILRERSKTLCDLVEMMRYFYVDFEDYDPKIIQKYLTPDLLAPLEALHKRLNATEDWTVEAIHEHIALVAQDLNVGMGKVAMPLRVAVSGTSNTPAIDVTVYWIGKERTMKRIQNVLRRVF